MSTKTKLLTLLTLTCVPVLGIVPFPAHPDIKTLSLYVSALAGYIGIMLLLWFYGLGTRGVIKPFTKDFAPIISLHKTLGKYATVLIFLHPLFVTISYGESWLYSFLPNVSSGFEMHVTYGRIAFTALLIVWVTSALLRSNMGYRPWKYLHLLAYLSLSFALLHIPDTGSSYTAHILPRAYFVMVALGFAVFSLLRLRSALNLNKFTYEIISNTTIADRTFVLRLRPTSRGHLTAHLGQYLYLKTGWFSEEHPFSILRIDDKTGELYVAYKTYGMFTRELSRLSTGTQVFVNGAFGRFTRKLDQSPDMPRVFITGGIGITPFLDRILSTHTDQWLFYATRTETTAAFLEPLTHHLGERCVSILDNAATVHSERPLQADLLHQTFAAHLLEPSRYQYFLCGPAPMMDAARASLIALGVNEQQIHSEAFDY